MSGHGRPPAANPSTSAAPANSARAAPSVPFCWSPPLGRDSKTTGGKGGKGGNLESIGNGALSDDGAKRRKPGGNWRKPPAGLCSRNRPRFCCLTQGVHSKALIGVSLAEIAEIPCKNLSRSQPHCASLFRVHSRICRRSIRDNPDDGSAGLKIVDVKAYPMSVRLSKGRQV